MKRLLTALAAALCLATGAWASGYWDLSSVTYGIVANDDTLTGTLNSDQKIEIYAGATITLRNATINRSNESLKCAGLTCRGNATIILEGNNTINGVSSHYPGIYVPPGCTLTIKGSGTLNATGKGGGAGIGGGYNIDSGSALNSGNVVIEGTPTINATGTHYAAGIGGGYDSTCGTITIKGGTINAHGDTEGGAGIGGGAHGTCGNITIQGGSITANGGTNTGANVAGAGIGGGTHGTCGTISITGGTIVANGGAEAAAIGGGRYNKTCGAITIGPNITKITAKTTSGSAFTVGKGNGGLSISSSIDETLLNTYTSSTFTRVIEPWDGNLANVKQSSIKVATVKTLTGHLTSSCKVSIASGVNITLRDATIDGASLNSSDNNTYSFAGINCEGGNYITLVDSNTISGFHTGYPGIHVPSGRWVVLQGSGTLNATGNGYAAGIGGGRELSCGNIYLWGNTTINATGYGYAAGIGGCYTNSCGTITITGGTITANGGVEGGAGIGGGAHGTCGNITIQGGSITANGGTNTGTNVAGAGIGGGTHGTCGTISITGGTIVANGGTEAAAIGGGRNNSTCGAITIGPDITKITAKTTSSQAYTVGKGNGGSTISYSFDETLLNTYTSSTFTRVIEPWDGNLANVKQLGIKVVNGKTLTGRLSYSCKVSIAEGASITLNNATINTNFAGNNDENYKWAGLTCLGDATITLVGSNTVKGFHRYYPGIYIPSGNTLTIDGSGSLSANRVDFAAGIGGGYEIDCGNITINGGTIEAYGGNYGAGIGGGLRAACGNITINGGTITAQGEAGAAGIGAGQGGAEGPSSCGTITIGSGITRVVASLDNPREPVNNPIGAGNENSTCGAVTVAVGLSDGLADFTRTIAKWDGDLSTLEGDVVVTGTKTITGTLSGKYKVSLAAGANVTLDNATIASGENNSNHKWAGLTCLGTATITLVGSNTLKGFYEDYPGIYVPKGSTLTIKGSGSLDASTGTRANSIGYAAGIGAGYTYTNGDVDLSCGNIVIDGGTITATGGNSAAGIGGACNSSCGNILINEGIAHVTARTNYSEPIGSGDNGPAGIITVAPGLGDETRGLIREIASTTSETVGGITWSYYVLFDKATVFGGVGTPAIDTATSGEITIPENLGGYPVTGIGNHAFYACRDLTGVGIPETVTFIGNYAFQLCFGLENVNIPSGLTSIGDSAFANTSLSGVDPVLPSSLTNIGEGAFAGTSLSSVILPSGLKNIANAAFNYCSSLKDVTIPDSVTNIADGAFFHCGALERIVIPENIESIGSQAFAYCAALTDIMAPASIGNIVSDANKNMFDGCDALQTIYVPYGCEDDVWSSLYSSGINTFAVRDGGFEKVGDYTWYYAFNDGGQTVRIERRDKLHNLVCAVSPAPVGAVQIPYTLGGYTVTGIGEIAFLNCSYLDGVVLTDNVTSIGAGAFSGCANPLLIKVVGMDRKSEVEQLLSQSGHDMAKINVDCGFAVDENGYYWYYNLVSDGNGGWTAEITDLYIGQNECQELVVPETLGGYPVASLANYAFSDRLPSTTTVTFPASVQTIGYGAFIGCDSLTTINVPAGSGAAMTAMLEESGLDMANITVVDPEPAKTVAEVAAELFDDAVINLTGETPSITIKTIPGFTYTVREGQTIKTMTSKSGDGKVKVGDGTEWTPTLEKYTTSGFYLIDVSK